MEQLSSQLTQLSIWRVALAAVLIVAPSCLIFTSWYPSDESAPKSTDIEDSLFNPLVLKDHSENRSYRTPHAVYKSIRTFYHPHPHAEKLPGAANLPLVIFIHGLGGSLSQFAPLLGSLLNIAPSFGIDFPGCGLSEFSPPSFSAYKIEALVSLVKNAVEIACAEHGHENVILVAHSYGCPISAILASDNSPAELRLSVPVLGVVSICPKASRVTKSQSRAARILFGLPNFLLDGVRWLDRRGGLESASVIRFVGKDADIDLKIQQLRFNAHFQTPVWKRTALGALTMYDSNGSTYGGIPGEDVWKGLNTPLLLIAGDSDTVTKVDELNLIVSYLKSKTQSASSSSSQLGSGPNIIITSTESKADDKVFSVQAETAETESHHANVIKTAILPAPAAHALLYDHAFYRIVAGLVEDFLARHVSEQLSLGWQLQKLTTSGKWDVKNLQKWKKVMPVSGPIDGGVFRALKTLREQDEEHTPSVFVERWSGKIYAVIDFSHDRPIYNTQTLEKGGIQYHKFPTVSKVPPTPAEVKGFIALVDRLRKEIKTSTEFSDLPAISCHCHYGYNRTGFFIISYLVEKEGYRLQDAIDEFAQQKPPGIRHDHFLDTLFVRYCVGLKKAPTFST